MTSFLQVRDALDAIGSGVPVRGEALAPDLPLAEGLARLRAAGAESLPVRDAAGEVLGCFSRDSALEALLRRQQTLQDASRAVQEAAGELLDMLGQDCGEEAFLEAACDRFRRLLGCRETTFLAGEAAAEETEEEALTMPVPGRNRALGQLCFRGPIGRRSFDSGDRVLARHLATLLGCMLQQLRLRSQEAELRHMLSQSQKMEALGRLAGCVAHDFNNLLTAIGGFAELLLDSLPAESGDRECAREILRACERASGVTRQLLALSRRQLLEPRDVEIHAFLAEIAPMFRVLLGERIRLELDFAPDAVQVHLDVAMLEQVLLNLLANARDAQPQGGRVVIRTRVQERAGVLAGAREVAAALPAGESFLDLEVEDEGPGMDAATLERIFEPFFTTRVGTGTGLGLATVFASVQQAGGLVLVRSTPGQGSVFTVLLPVAGGRPEPAAAPAQASPRGRGETVLVVEDEPHLGVMARRLLESLGYRARLAATVAEARQDVEREGAPALLLTDVILPDGTGEEFALWLQERHPDIPVLFTSGYADADPPRSMGACRVAFLPKPWNRRELAGRLASLLAPPRGEPCRVLAVDDQPQVRDLLARFLAEAGHDVRVAAGGAEAEVLLEGWTPDVLVCDVVMPGLSGVEVASRLRRRAPAMRTVMISGAANASFHLGAARRLGAVACLEKPVTRDTLLEAVARAASRPAAPVREG